MGNFVVDRKKSTTPGIANAVYFIHGMKLRNGVNGFSTNYATATRRVLQQILDIDPGREPRG